MGEILMNPDQLKLGPISLQKQPTPITCVQTCIAMAVGEPVEKVIERYGQGGLSMQKLMHALSECQIDWNSLLIPQFMFTGWYFAVVPSLNIRGGNHQIIIHYNADRGCNGFTVFDPSTKETYASDGSDLRSWECLMPFHPGGKLP